MQFAADDHVELLRAMSEVNNAGATIGCAEPAPELAFLPNLMPTYVTEHEGQTVHMFSLVYQADPTIQQGWRLMLRGLDLKPLLCDKTTIQILELVGGVDHRASANRKVLDAGFCGKIPKIPALKTVK